MTGVATQQKPIRVFRIRTPGTHYGPLGLVILAGGILFSWVVAYALLALAVSPIAQRVFSVAPTSFFIALALFAAIGPFIWVRIFRRWRFWNAHRKTSLRTRRLARIVGQPGAIQKLPHRVVEYLMRRGPLSSRRLNRFIHDAPPLFVVVANYSPKHPPWPLPVSVPFEPVELRSDRQRILMLVTATLEAQYGTAFEVTGNTTELRSFRSLLLRSAWFFYMFVFVLLPVCYLVYDFAIHGIGWHNIFPILIILYLLSLTLIPLVAERKWWLVPGGLVYREYRVWRSRLRAGFIKPFDTPLIVDVRSGIAFVRRRRNFLGLRCPNLASWVLVAAWLSRARPPTVEEIEAFLGQKLS